MDIVCRILYQFQLIDREEEEQLKRKIKDCIYNYSGSLNNILYNEKYNNIDLSKVYSTMNVSNIGHIIAFYCVLESYNKKSLVCKTKEEKESYIVQLTIGSLNDFSMFKKNHFKKKEKLSSLFYQYIKNVGIDFFISSVGGYIYNIYI